MYWEHGSVSVADAMFSSILGLLKNAHQEGIQCAQCNFHAIFPYITLDACQRGVISLHLRVSFHLLEHCDCVTTKGQDEMPLIVVAIFYSHSEFSRRLQSMYFTGEAFDVCFVA